MIPNEYDGLPQNTIDLLLGRETTDVEFKQGLGEVEAEYFAAFANASGGVILVGIAPDKQVAGCTKNDDEIRRILLGRADTCRPSIISLTEIHEEKTTTGKRVYRVEILEGKDKPYCTQSGLYKSRADGRNRAIYPDELRRMVIENSKFPQKIEQIENALQESKQVTEQLAKKIPSEAEIGYILADKLRGF